MNTPSPTTGRPASKRRRIFLLTAAVLLVVGVALAWKPVSRFWRIYHPTKQDLPLPKTLWAMEAGEGAAVTKRNLTDADLTPLRKAFETQIHGSYCGVASSVIALKTLGSTAQQTTFFSPKTAAIRSERQVFYGGMTLDELGKLLTAHGAKTTVVHASDSSVDAFRTEARANVEGSGDVLLINYYRKTLEQKGGGHISPVAAYDTESDRFLVLDVSSYKYPPVWVTTALLFKAMTTVDSSASLSRGWVHVRLPGAS